MRIATSFLVHTHDCSWQDQPVSVWTKSHAAQIQRAGFATGLQQLHETHGKRALEQIKHTGRYGTDSWDYISRNYAEMFGKDNQVGKQP